MWYTDDELKGSSVRHGACLWSMAVFPVSGIQQGFNKYLCKDSKTPSRILVGIYASYFSFQLCCCLVTQLAPTLATPWVVARQAPLSMGSPRQEYWSWFPFPSPGLFPAKSPFYKQLRQQNWWERFPRDVFHLMMLLLSRDTAGFCSAAAKSLQSCPNLCDPKDGSPPGSLAPGFLQAQTLEWVAISFSNAWKWKVKVKALSGVWLFETPWTVAYQAPLSMGFSRQEYWSGSPVPSPGFCSRLPYFCKLSPSQVQAGHFLVMDPTIISSPREEPWWWG